MPNEHDFTQGRNPLIGDDDKLWSAPDEQAAENEVSEFIGALIRLIKPKTVVETGCYLGDTTGAIASAMLINNISEQQFFACDIDLERVESVQRRIMGLHSFGSTLTIKGIDLIKHLGTIDFALIDSSPDARDRYEEIVELVKHLRPGGMFAVHDTAPHHRSMAEMVEKVKLLGGFEKIQFNTPRGLTLFKKI